jgi:ubiquinone/menaquinone biosynthesis C-methylase UbiE
MSDLESWRIADEPAVAYERDFVPAIFAQWPPVVAAAADIRPGDRVLDVACGTGVLAREAAVRVVPGGRVVGLDINPAMLSVARRLRPEIEWRQGDAAALPFEDAAFDAVVSQFALMFFPDPVAALREMGRVLAPGGRLAVAVCAPIERAPGYRLLGEMLRRHVGAQAGGLVDTYFALGEPARLEELGRAAGLADVTAREHSGQARFASIDELVRIEIKGSPLGALVDEPSYAALLAEARERFIDFRDASGAVALPLDATILSATKA